MPRKKNPAVSTVTEPTTIDAAQIASLIDEVKALRLRNAELEDQIGAPAIRGDSERARLSGTVTIACKIPSGLRLQLQHKMERPIPTGRGDNDYEMKGFNVFGGPVHHVFGPAVPAMGGVPNGYILPSHIEGGYAFTRGIPADFWEKWLGQNKEADYVVNRMIFAMPNITETKAKAREHGKTISGLEPLQLNEKGELTDWRTPKPINKAVARIATDADRENDPQRHPAMAED